MFVEGTLPSVQYVQNVVKPVLLTFLQQEGDVLFQQDNARPHTALATQCALQDVQQLPWPARSPGMSPIEHGWDMMGRQVTRVTRPPTTLTELRERVG